MEAGAGAIGVLEAADLGELVVVELRWKIRDEVKSVKLRLESLPFGWKQDSRNEFIKGRLSGATGQQLF